MKFENYRGQSTSQDIIKMFVNLLRTKKQECSKAWDKVFKQKKQNLIVQFCKEVGIQNSSFLYEVEQIKTKIIAFMNGMAMNMKRQQRYKSNCQNLQKQILQILKNNPINFSDRKQREKSLHLKGNSKSGKSHFKAQQVKVTIVYNNLKFEIDYNWQKITIKKQLVRLIKLKLYKRQILVLKPQKIVFASLDQKQDYGDKYTDSYTFDPFFNSIKIRVIREDRQKITSSFLIDDPENLQIEFENNQKHDDWKDQNSFNLKDNVNLLVDMICDKTQTPGQIRQELIQGLQKHGIQTLNDLIKSGDQFIDDFCKFRKKWGNQFKIQMGKLIKRKVKIFSGYENISQEKKNCYRIGNAHKILRYLYYSNNNSKGEGMEKIKLSIPWLNPKNVSNAIKIVKKQIINQKLFQQIQTRTFESFKKIPDLQKISKPQTQPGILFYGPPGTGKTKLTQQMTELMGFHLITRGLSSAEFMKELVGQMKGTVESYLYRPNLSPYLMCSMAIDQIQIIVGDRNDKDTKSGQATAMFLSALGGIMNVQNVLVLGSTNHKDKVDSAILRRFTPFYYVGVPSRQQRKKIILNYLNLMKAYPNQLQFLVSITPNFSGAAIKILCQDIYNLEDKKQKLLKQDLIYIVDAVACSFKLKFGEQSYPILYKKVRKQLNVTFLQKIFKGLLFIEKVNIQNNSLQICYGTPQKQWNSQKQHLIFQINRNILKIKKNLIHKGSSLPMMEQYLNQTNQQNSLKNFKIIKIKDQNDLQKQMRDRNQPTFLLLPPKNINYLGFFFSQLFLNNKFKNLYLVCDLTYYESKSKAYKQLLEPIGFIDSVYKEKYTGRVFLNLSEQPDPKMEFQIFKGVNNKENTYFRKNFVQENFIKRTKDALPQLVEELMTNNVDFFQFISAQTLNQNNCYDQQSIKKYITSKFQEAKMYQNSAIIIDIDSIVFLSRNISKSLQGKDTQSLSIHNANVYHSLVDSLKNFSNQEQNSYKFLVVISTDTQLVKIIKKDIVWPLSADQKKAIYTAKRQKQQEELKKKKRTCLFCDQVFTQESNQQEKKCLVHFGYLVDNIDYDFLQPPTTNNQAEYQRQAKFKQYEYNQFRFDKQFQMKYVYACCFGDIGSQPCGMFYHWGGLQDQKAQCTAIKSREINYKFMKKKCTSLKQGRDKFMRQLQQRKKKQRQRQRRGQ